MPVKYDDIEIIRPGLVRNFTGEQISELVKCSKDVKYFANNHYRIVHPTKGLMIIQLFDFQERMLEHYQSNRFNIVLSSRQIGKTVCSCIFLLWFAIFNENKTIAILANKQRTAGSIIEEIKTAYKKLPMFLKPGIEQFNEMSISFDNGTKIFASATTEDALRGESVSLLFCLGGENTVKIRNKITGEIKEVSLEELYTKDFGKNNESAHFTTIDSWSIQTPSGWSDFRGIQKIEQKKLINISFKDGTHIRATKDHSFYINGQITQVQSLNIGDSMDSVDSVKEIIDIKEDTTEDVYDIIESSNNHQFIVNNDIITKNCDEFAFVPQNICQKFWSSNFPTLSTGGAAILVSTPNGSSGLFYQIYKEAEDNTSPFKPFKVNWWEFPGRDEKWKEDMIASIGKVAFAQEYGCSFTGSTVTLIDGDVLSNLHGSVAPFIPAPFYEIWKKYVPGRVYAFGIDTAQGAGSDYSIVMIYDITDYPTQGIYELVAQYRRNDINIFDFADEVFDLGKKWGNPVMNCEINETGLGDVLVKKLYHELGYERIYFSYEYKTYGIKSNAKTKKIATTHFKEDIEADKCKVCSAILVEELGTFEEKSSQRGTFAARKGKGFHDDTVAASYWVSYMLKSDWFKDMMDEIYSKKQISVPVEKVDQQQVIDENTLNLFNNLFLNSDEDNWEKELWREDR